MKKLPPTRLFFKVYNDLLDQGLDWHEAGLIFYLERLQSRNLPCFASVETIAAELRIPYRTMRRVIDGLITKGLVTSTTQGRKRILSVANNPSAKVSKMDNVETSVSVQNGQDEGVQNGQLPRSNIPRFKYLDLNINNNNNNLNLGNNYLGNKSKYEMVWDDKRKVMVRKRIAV
jgi:hypothetical protein